MCVCVCARARVRVCSAVVCKYCSFEVQNLEPRRQCYMRGESRLWSLFRRTYCMLKAQHLKLPIASLPPLRQSEHKNDAHVWPTHPGVLKRYFACSCANPGNAEFSSELSVRILHFPKMSCMCGQGTDCCKMAVSTTKRSTR